MLVRNIIKAAYANLGAIDGAGEPESWQYEQGLQSLNSMLASWSREKLTIYGAVDESFTLTPGDGVYTVGVGADFNTAWPFDVINAFYRDANGIDTPLVITTQGQYDSLADKSISARPEYLVYDPKGYPTGTATLYPVPDSAYTLFWTAQKVITSYASIDATVGIAPEYEEALEYNLTLRLAPKCRVPVSQEIAALARISKSVIPVDIEPAQFDGAFKTRTRYNIFSDNV